MAFKEATRRVEIVKLRAALLVRRGWKATVFLALLAGLAGGVAMAAWSLGRKTSTAFERFFAYSDPRDLFVSVCPPELTLEMMAADQEAALQQCLMYVPTDEAATAREMPGVAAAGSVAYIGFTASPVDAPERVAPGLSVVSFDRGLEWPEGRPVMVDGRTPDPAAPDEISINEHLAKSLGVGVGEEVDLGFWSTEETSNAALPGERFTGPSARARIVGVERNFRDLIADVGSETSEIDESRITAGPGLAATLTESGRWGAMLMSVTDDVAASSALEEEFADQLYIAEPLISADDLEPVAEAIRYEARGAMLFGAITALAALIFSAQAISRQSRREWADGPTMRTLGMSTREAAGAALARGAVTGALAVAVGIVAAVLLSLLGPFGYAAEAETEHGPVIDWLVLGVGAAVSLVAIAVATCWPVVRQFRHSSRWAVSGGPAGLPSLQRHVPPAAAVGLNMTLSRRGAGRLPTGTALTGLALAFTTAIVAAILASSFDVLSSTPSHFGVSWEVSVSTPIEASDEQRERVVEWLGSDSRVDSAAGLPGSEMLIGEQVARVQAFAPIDGVDAIIPPVITSGRAPEAIDEIALGSATMAEEGVSIGDEIDVNTYGPGAITTTMTVVGTTVINDTLENNAGRGGVVTAAWMEENEAPSTYHYVVTLAPGSDVDQFGDDLRSVAPGGTVQGPVPQGGIRNVERVRIVPILLAALVGILAIASLAHALVLSVRRHRHELAVLKSLGFRRGQVRTAVAWHATALVAVAAVVGVPLGIVVGRWGWRVVADGLGVASPPSTPALWLPVIVLAIVAVANLVAAYPAWAAGRTPTAAALRTE